MQKHLEPKTHFIIISLTVAAALSFLGFVIFYYALPAIIQESNAIEQTKTNLTALEEKKNILLEEEEKTKSLSAKLDMIDAAIVPANNPVAFFRLLGDLAARENLSIEIKPASAQNAPQNTIALMVSVTGAPKQGIDFTKNITTFPFVLTVSDIALSRDVTVASSETNQNIKTVTPVLGKTTITINVFVASRP